jgi:hypothetical protein
MPSLLTLTVNEFAITTRAPEHDNVPLGYNSVELTKLSFINCPSHNSNVDDISYNRSWQCIIEKASTTLTSLHDSDLTAADLLFIQSVGATLIEFHHTFTATNEKVPFHEWCNELSSFTSLKRLYLDFTPPFPSALSSFDTSDYDKKSADESDGGNGWSRNEWDIIASNLINLNEIRLSGFGAQRMAISLVSLMTSSPPQIPIPGYQLGIDHQWRITPLQIYVNGKQYH